MPQSVLTPEEANAMGKTPFDEVIDFIVSECNDAAANLPDTYVGQPNNETGRITKGFAMALKSKALLYKASLLHNPLWTRKDGRLPPKQLWTSLI
ncbi:hypothetical protein SFC43_22510 [Bacteroides sp. CR5/BHMF/2]|nr:hypothetical protein [Bacteroides sp. CR5/BHMF/2]